jgi:mRNA-degrading endonuclease toxin of MazEF toxin-antitoxin module
MQPDLDKVTTMLRSELGEHIGRLTDEDMLQLDRSMVVVLLLGT